MSPTEGSPKRKAPEGTVAPYTAKWVSAFHGESGSSFLRVADDPLGAEPIVRYASICDLPACPWRNIGDTVKLAFDAASISARLAAERRSGAREKDCDLFVWDARNIDSAVNAFTRLIPINLSGCDCHTHTCAAVAELD